MQDLDKAQQELQNIIREVSQPGYDIESEEDTRVKIIDRVLFDVLGWPRGQTKTEPHFSSIGYADYLLLNPEKRSLCVLEAKRKGRIIVDTVSNSRIVCKYDNRFVEGARGGIDQSISYSGGSGAPYAIVSNGTSWIFLRTQRLDGLPVKDGKMIVYPTLETALQHFPEFIELASYSAITDKLYKIRLDAADGMVVPNAEPRHFAFPPNDIRMLPKDEFTHDLERIFSEFFSNMTDEKDQDLLVNCFVESRESKIADVGLSKITSNLVNYVQSISSSTGDELTRQIASAVEATYGEVVLIVGNKGAGKSTFIDRFFKKTISRELKDKCLVLRIDVGISTGELLGIQPWLTSQLINSIERQLFKGRNPTYDELLGIFFSQYKRWSEGEFKHLYESDKIAFKNKFGEFVSNERRNNPFEYMMSLLHHAISSRILMPCIVFDNIDHYNNEFQETVFQYSQSINKRVTSFIILPITDRTIWKLSKAGPIQSFVSKTFYLPVPSTKEVIEKRVNYIKAKTAEKGKVGRYFLTRGIRLEIRDIQAFASTIEEIFINMEYVARLIGWLGNHDIRRSLQLASAIITSPALGIDKIVKTMISGGQIRVRNYEIMRALLWGNYGRFNSQYNNYVLNIFDLPPDVTTSPLLIFRILQALLAVHTGAGDDVDRAYISVPNLENYIEALGIDTAHFRWALKVLLDRRLVEPYDPSEEKISDNTTLTITPAGRIHLEFAENDAVYLEQTALVTGLRDHSKAYGLREEMFSKTVFGAARWYNIRNTFIEYLLTEDSTKVTVPSSVLYQKQASLNAELGRKWAILS